MPDSFAGLQILDRNTVRRAFRPGALHVEVVDSMQPARRSVDVKLSAMRFDAIRNKVRVQTDYGANF